MCVCVSASVCALQGSPQACLELSSAVKYDRVLHLEQFCTTLLSSAVKYDRVFPPGLFRAVLHHSTV